MEKPWWESKTLWLNAITFLVSVLALAEVLAVVPVGGLGYVAAAAAVLNVALRIFFTDTKLVS